MRSITSMTRMTLCRLRDARVASLSSRASRPGFADQLVTSTGMTALDGRHGLQRSGWARATGEQVPRHLLQNEPLDGFGVAARVGPPPAVLMHGAGGGDEAVGDRLEVGV